MLRKQFGERSKERVNEGVVRVVLPEETYTLIEYKQEDLPCIAAINSGLVDFKHRDIFPWHLSVIIDFEDVVEQGMPSVEEREVVDPFCDQLDEDTKAGGNALFLVRETWNMTRRLVWMVHNPEIADMHLKYIIEHTKYPREFDYRMESDVDWKQAKWYLDAVET